MQPGTPAPPTRGLKGSYSSLPQPPALLGVQHGATPTQDAVPRRAGAELLSCEASRLWSCGLCPSVMQQNYVPGGKQDHLGPSTPKHIPRISKHCQRPLMSEPAPRTGTPCPLKSSLGPQHRPVPYLLPAPQAWTGIGPFSPSPASRHPQTFLTVTMSASS